MSPHLQPMFINITRNSKLTSIIINNVCICARTCVKGVLVFRLIVVHQGCNNATASLQMASMVTLWIG